VTNIMSDIKRIYSSARMIPLILITTGCFSKSKEETCTPLLQDILDVQRIREVVREDFHITMKDYKEGRLSPRVWEESKEDWLEKENRLATKADDLYSHAYNISCLD